MLFLDHTQIQYCKIKNQDKTILGLIYNNNLFIREKAFPKEEMEIAIKECREEYLDHDERSKIATLLVKEKDGIGIWMENNEYKSDIISTSNSNQKESKSPVSSGHKKSKANLNRISVRQLAQEMRSEQGVEIKTRRYKLKLYQRCFVGNEAVDWIISKTKLSRTDAVSLGQKMLEKGIFHHVLDEHEFKDEPLFYRFDADEGKSIWNSSL
ncbi:MAG: DEP domain-containing protein [Cyanobacteria bacterium P01_G01_bin.39]